MGHRLRDGGYPLNPAQAQTRDAPQAPTVLVNRAQGLKAVKRTWVPPAGARARAVAPTKSFTAAAAAAKTDAGAMAKADTKQANVVGNDNAKVAAKSNRKPTRVIFADTTFAIRARARKARLSQLGIKAQEGDGAGAKTKAMADTGAKAAAGKAAAGKAADTAAGAKMEGPGVRGGQLELEGCAIDDDSSDDDSWVSDHEHWDKKKAAYGPKPAMAFSRIKVKPPVLPAESGLTTLMRTHSQAHVDKPDQMQKQFRDQKENRPGHDQRPPIPTPSEHPVPVAPAVEGPPRQLTWREQQRIFQKQDDTTGPPHEELQKLLAKVNKRNRRMGRFKQQVENQQVGNNHSQRPPPRPPGELPMGGGLEGPQRPRPLQKSPTGDKTDKTNSQPAPQARPSASSSETAASVSVSSPVPALDRVFSPADHPSSAADQHSSAASSVPSQPHRRSKASESGATEPRATPPRDWSWTGYHGEVDYAKPLTGKATKKAFTTREILEPLRVDMLWERAITFPDNISMAMREHWLEEHPEWSKLGKTGQPGPDILKFDWNRLDNV